ncbi:KxYKxGKxW signal peptide domain-containing protein [Levilactobacillus namurensis]|uniref:KxYKxGKxW signal peptide domain-containing protein n=2 Tax=Levilactobacillus namurensis TaxID=380393 RepID=UPI001D3D1532|nr:KxYKxGKxW signal peptide domain-containing protein [Levilactobacillus namurensis]HJE44158.1 KxYKxGKxW signal peptide domain-containing protein [Levilactobacillus namurensis]
MLETKVHYKSYKAGKRWLYAAISVTSLCAGLALTVPANAATTDSDSTPVTETVNADSSSNNENATNSNVDPANTNGSTNTDETNESNALNDNTKTNQANSNTSNNDADSNGANTNDSLGDSSTNGTDANELTNDTSSNGTDTSNQADESNITDTDVNNNSDNTNPNDSNTQQDQDTQLAAPKDLANSSEITDPLAVIKTGVAQDQSQDKLGASITVTATNSKGTQTSQASSESHNQEVAVNTQDSSLTATFNVTNHSDTKQGLWVYLEMPAYLNNATSMTVSPSIDADSLTNTPEGVQLTFITLDGSYKVPTGFDWTTLKEIELTGTMNAGDHYSVSIPLTIPESGTSADLGIADFGPDWYSSSMKLQTTDPVLYHAPTNLPTATQQTPAATVDPDVTTPIAAITNNPDLQEKANTAPVDATIRLTAKNENGLGVSLTSQSDTGNGDSMTVVDGQATDLTALLDVTNTTDAVQIVNTFFSLPTYYNLLYPTHTSTVTMSDDVNAADLLADLPSGLAVHYVTSQGEYNSYADLLAKEPNFQWSDLTQFHVVGFLASQSGYTLNVPLTAQKTDQYTINGGSIMSQYSYGAVHTDAGFYFRIADTLDDLSGQYQAVVANPNAAVDGDPYLAAPKEIQAAMPNMGKDQIAYHNFFTGTSGSTTDHPYNGGVITINYQNADFADAINHLGYAVALSTDRQPYQMMGYIFKGTPTMIQNPTENPSVYVVVRQVLQTQDKTLQVGDNWNQLDNFVAGFDNQDQPLQASDVQVYQISDPSGIVQDGKVTAAGTFTVTYAYQVADDYYGKGEPYMVYKTATVTVDAPDPVDPTPTDPDNPGTTTPTDPSTDPDNPGTTTPTDPSTDPDNPGTTTPTDPSTNPDNPGTTTPVDPSTPTNPDTTTGNETVVTGGSGDTATVTTPSATTDDSVEANDANTATTATPLVTSGDADSVNTTQKSTTSAKVIHGGDGATVTTGKSAVAANQAQAKTATPATATTLSAQTTTPKATATTSTQLPQTNEAKPNGLAILGMGLLTGALSLVGLKSRKHD